MLIVIIYILICTPSTVILDVYIFDLPSALKKLKHTHDKDDLRKAL